MAIDLNGPFRGSDALAAGLLTRGVLRGPRYRRLFPDEREALLTRLGWTILRFDAHTVLNEPARMVAAVEGLIAYRVGSRSSPRP
jgi:hypothetical protein